LYFFENVNNDVETGVVKLKESKEPREMQRH
jgi:hypothetical protein